MLRVYYLPRLQMVFTGTDGYTRTLPIRDIQVDMITHKGVVVLDKLYEDWSHSFPIEPPTEEQPSMTYDGKTLILTGVTLTYELYEGTHPSKEKLYIGCNREGYKYHEDSPQAHDDWEFEASSGPLPTRVTKRKLYPNMLPMQGDTCYPVGEFDGDTWYETFTNQGEDVSIDNVIIDPRDMNEVATGLNTRVYLFGNKVDTHYIKVEYREGYGPICTISFLANKVSMALDRVEEKVLYPIPNTARHIIQGYTHMGERIPQYFDVIDCQWGDNNEVYEH